MCQSLGHQFQEISFAARSAEKGNLNDPPVFSRSIIVARDITPTHHVENDIGSLAVGCFADCGNEIG